MPVQEKEQKTATAQALRKGKLVLRARGALRLST